MGDVNWQVQLCVVPGKAVAQQSGTLRMAAYFSACLYLPRLPEASPLLIGKVLHMNVIVMFEKQIFAV